VTVKELIAKLREFNEEAEVWSWDDYRYEEFKVQLVGEEKGKVWIQ